MKKLVIIGVKAPHTSEVLPRLVKNQTTFLENFEDKMMYEYEHKLKEAVSYYPIKDMDRQHGSVFTSTGCGVLKSQLELIGD